MQAIDNRSRYSRDRVRINRMIRVSEVRVINHDGEQLGVMPTRQAQELAQELGYDLVEVSPTAKPPVCRIMDYGKYKYEEAKKQKESKKKQHVIQVKEVKFRPKTEEHDYQFKKRHAEEFLKKHHKVKFTIVFRGRELSHKEMGERILKRVAEDLAHVGEIERPARFEGRLMIMYMAPFTGKTQVQEKKSESKKPETPKKPAEAPKAVPEITPEPKQEAAPKADNKAVTDKEETTEPKKSSEEGTTDAEN